MKKTFCIKLVFVFTQKYSDVLWKMKKILKVNGHNEVPRLKRQMQSIAQRSVPFIFPSAGKPLCQGE
jgi:hypothetical protein